MSAIRHHVPDEMLAAYASGGLSHPFAVAVAAHVSVCVDCRAALGAHQTAGGVLMENSAPVPLSDAALGTVMARLDEVDDAPVYRRQGIYPGPVMQALGGRDPRWKSLGMGVKQDILFDGSDGSVRLLYIPGGQAVPDHGHHGTEMTLVLQGSFSDETGRFGPGDVEMADEDLEHTPIADPGPACICLASADAKLRFRSLIPRLLQPIFRI